MTDAARCHLLLLLPRDILHTLAEQVADPLLQQICWREGLTDRSRMSLVGRC